MNEIKEMFAKARIYKKRLYRMHMPRQDLDKKLREHYHKIQNRLNRDPDQCDYCGSCDELLMKFNLGRDLQAHSGSTMVHDDVQIYCCTLCSPYYVSTCDYLFEHRDKTSQEKERTCFSFFT